ncbi:hypothetical protein [Amycolatopsis jejuensis]|uniref:hypothetical protein n=1 Tax=Amycolatopsis jejuensis TaxID=330084 RepID=UPI0012E0265A|nr:hypothetical protein [Amycolatopsis jejuensis]
MVCRPRATKDPDPAKARLAVPAVTDRLAQLDGLTKGPPHAEQPGKHRVDP